MTAKYIACVKMCCQTGMPRKRTRVRSHAENREKHHFDYEKTDPVAKKVTRLGLPEI